jgi:hypothetical protein
MDVRVMVHREGRPAVQVDHPHAGSHIYAFSGSGMCVSSEADDIKTGCTDGG